MAEKNAKHNEFEENALKQNQTEDPNAHRAPGDVLTEQNQPKDVGPPTGKRPVGQHNYTGRPPLMKK